MAIEDAEYIGVTELAAAVGDALSEIAQSDKRMKSGATEIPGERTIRFYLEKGLLPKPAKRLGQTLVFGRVHLLTLLVIKKLQADGVPLSGIPEILKKRGRTEGQLEGLLSEGGGMFGSRRDLEAYRMQTGPMDEVGEEVSFAQTAMPRQEFGDEPHEQAPKQVADISEPPASGAKSYLRSLLTRSTPPPAMSARVRTEKKESEILFSRMSEPQPARWTRHEPVDGLEINISDDYEAPKDEQGKARLLDQVRKILGV